MPDLVPAAPAFRYADAPPEHRPFLREATDSIRGLCARSAANLLRIGSLLAQARDRLPRGTFCAWAAAELPWSLTHTYRMMDAAAQFADTARVSQIDKIEPSALYVLSAPQVPPAARAYALQLAADGQRVTHATAREILDAHRPAGLPSMKDARKVLERGRLRPDEDASKALPPREPTPDEEAWRAILGFLARGATVAISVMTEEGGDDEDAAPLYSVVAHVPGVPRICAVRRTANHAALAAAGREPVRSCPACGGAKPVGLFGYSKRGGVNVYCKACERPRIAAAKKKHREKRAVPASPAPRAA